MHRLRTKLKPKIHNPYCCPDSPPPPPPTIISRDESRPIDEDVKPLIRDILRTKYCIQGSIFLVESIDRAIVVRGKNKSRAIRLTLGDGELCIQAMARPEIHCFVDNEQVFEGCYVRLDKFDLRLVALAEKVKKMVYLMVGNMITVGWNRTLLAMEGKLDFLERRPRGGYDQELKMGLGVNAKLHMEKMKEKEKQKENYEEWLEGFNDDDEEFLRAEVIPQSPDTPSKRPLDFRIPRSPETPSKSRVPVEETNKGNADDEDSISDSDDEAFRLLFSGLQPTTPAKATETAARVQDPDNLFMTSATAARVQPAPELPSSPPIPEHLPERIQTPKKFIFPPQNAVTSAEENAKRPWKADDPATPLKLTELRAISSLPYQQNYMVNILAVVTSLDEVERTTFPPYTQRKARVMDMSTKKQVLLTVHLDPQSFTPRINSVVFLMGVKNHKFEGGSLRKYATDRLKSGKSWWVQWPETLGWCTPEVERLRSWWEARQLVFETMDAWEESFGSSAKVAGDE
ncbi:hypothetical protein QBC35DRAFT_379442 [Podospora australis]|uniref:Uncharacterized protein n=1 Tax=Podospora australis TaxID=1536484 RepID=A0AAN6WY51_9PEZI|nr:hypothetical protein QBC35DRAFT_379442 [Podospora australis]